MKKIYLLLITVFIFTVFSPEPLKAQDTVMVQAGPNPARNIINIFTNNTDYFKDAVIELYDIRGKSLLFKKFDGYVDLTRFDPRLESGVYIIAVRRSPDWQVVAYRKKIFITK